MPRENIMTYVRYFRWLIDDEWERMSPEMSDRKRVQHVLTTHWRSLSKDLRKNGYRRRIWRRLVEEKVERRQEIRQIMPWGITPKWLRRSMGDQ